VLLLATEPDILPRNMPLKLTSRGDLWCCSYRSTQVKHMTRADVATLLRDAQMRNMNLNITGLLLHIDNKFIQYVEGPKEALSPLIERILADPRHHQVELLFEGPLKERLFADWSMAFGDLSGQLARRDGQGSLLQQVLVQPAPADRKGRSNDVFHRFWAGCAHSLPV
jgi:hypothetical protein